MGTPTQTEALVRFTPSERTKIERVRELFTVKNQAEWEIGDLVLEIAGPSGTEGSMGRLTALAAELNQPVITLARYRVTSEVFPVSERRWDLPHYAYLQVQAYPAAAPAILQRVTDNPVPYSDTLLKDTKDEVLAEMELQNRRPSRLTPLERWINQTLTLAERISKSQVTVTRSEANDALQAFRTMEPLLRLNARK